MLIRFTVSNYLSFKERQIINFIPDSIKELDKTNIGTSEHRDLKLLKSIGVYGANAGGKSNLLKSLAFLKRFATRSAVMKQTGEPILVEPFKLSTTTFDRPSFFEIEFCIKEIRYRYGIEVSPAMVQKEWLYNARKTKESLIFERNFKEYAFGRSFHTLEVFKDKTRENATFLSVISQFNNEVGREIVDWFNKIRILLDNISDSHLNYTANLLEDPKYRRSILKLLKTADLGIEDIKTKRLDPDIYFQMQRDFKSLGDSVFSKLSHNTGFEINTVHGMYNERGELIRSVDFNISNESEGTRKFFAMAGRIAEVLFNGSILIIDELDSRLHPLLSRSIIRYFNSITNNHKNAQLIFATHNASLLSSKLLRRDQIYLIEKNNFEESSLQSLARNKEKIRSDASYVKNYLKGKYGGVPTIRQLSLFNEDSLHPADNGDIDFE